MADFRTLKINPAADKGGGAVDAQEETQALVRLAQIELESKRLAVQKRVTQAMMAVTALFAVFTVGLIVILGVSLQQMRAALDAINENIGPDTVQTAVASLQTTLYNSANATGNMRILSEDVSEVGVKLVEAANTSVALLARSNELMTQIQEHPQFTFALGTSR